MHSHPKKKKLKMKNRAYVFIHAFLFKKNEMMKNRVS